MSKNYIVNCTNQNQEGMNINNIENVKEKNMDRELQNRERRLRYKARQKGLRIRKDSCLINNEKRIGYQISRYGSPVVLTGYNRYNNLISIDEAEEYVAEY